MRVGIDEWCESREDGAWERVGIDEWVRVVGDRECGE